MILHSKDLELYPINFLKDQESKFNFFEIVPTIERFWFWKFRFFKMKLPSNNKRGFIWSKIEPTKTVKFADDNEIYTIEFVSNFDYYINVDKQIVYNSSDDVYTIPKCTEVFLFKPLADKQFNYKTQMMLKVKLNRFETFTYMRLNDKSDRGSIYLNPHLEVALTDVQIIHAWINT